MSSMQHNVVEHSEHYIPCFSAMPSAVVLHHNDQSGSTCTSIYTSNAIQPNSIIIVSLCLTWHSQVKTYQNIKIVFMSGGFSPLRKSQRLHNLIVWNDLFDTQVTPQRHLFVILSFSQSALCASTSGRGKPQGVQVLHSCSILFTCIWTNEIRFWATKIRKMAAISIFLKAIPSAITIINLVKETSTANVVVKKKII